MLTPPMLFPSKMYAYAKVDDTATFLGVPDVYCSEEMGTSLFVVIFTDVKLLAIDTNNVASNAARTEVNPEPI
jgi:hypothetical protein